MTDSQRKDEGKTLAEEQAERLAEQSPVPAADRDVNGAPLDSSGQNGTESTR